MILQRHCHDWFKMLKYFILFVCGGKLEMYIPCVYTCIGIHVEPRNWHQVSTIYFNCWDRIYSSILLEWVTNPRMFLACFSKCWNCCHMSPSPSISVGSEDQNSDVQACPTKTLTSELFLQLLNDFTMKGVIFIPPEAHTSQIIILTCFL